MTRAAAAQARRQPPGAAGATQKPEKGAQKPPRTAQGQKTTTESPRVKRKAPGASTATKRRPKFLNEPIDFMGHHFDSKAEGARYMGLHVAQQMGEIRDLEVHPRFPLVIHGEDCGYYEADFGYVVVSTGERVIEDVKSPVTRKLSTYRLKIKMVWALYGLRVREIV